MQEVAGRILALPGTGTRCVAIDGVDGAGKTCFGDELATVLAMAGRPLIRASVDGFHRPRAARWARGRDSPEGFYFDSYDYQALICQLLEPLRSGGHYQVAVFDHQSDSPVAAAPQTAPPQAILLFDGIFLQRPELRAYWDFTIFLRVDFCVSIPRCAARGDGVPDPDAPQNRRYVEGQRLYLRSCSPEQRADLLIDNNQLARPLIVSEPGLGG